MHDPYPPATETHWLRVLDAQAIPVELRIELQVEHRTSESSFGSSFESRYLDASCAEPNILHSRATVLWLDEEFVSVTYPRVRAIILPKQLPFGCRCCVITRTCGLLFGGLQMCLFLTACVLLSWYSGLVVGFCI